MQGRNLNRLHRLPLLRMERVFLLTLTFCFSMGTSFAGEINWAAWTHAMLASPEGQKVQKQGSDKKTAQWLSSKATTKMAAVGIVPTTGAFDIAGNLLLQRGSGQCGDVAIILEDVFTAAGIGHPIFLEAFVSEEDDAPFQSLDDPFGFNTGHGILAMSLDGELVAFDPWMASYTQSLLSGDRWSYGGFKADNKWNAMPLAEWWDSMQEKGYTRFWAGLPGYDGVSSQQHTNQVSGAVDIEEACNEYLENKGVLVEDEVWWDEVPNAGIPGYNDLIKDNISLKEAKIKCITENFKSFDYEPKAHRAFFQNVNKDDVKLKTDYKDNPYNHYTLRRKPKTR